MAISPYVGMLRGALGHGRILIPSVAGIARDGERILLVQQVESPAQVPT